jgi:hypothetical protein
MLLYGTKLWIALYIRWSRLCRTSMWRSRLVLLILSAKQPMSNGVHHHRDVKYINDKRLGTMLWYTLGFYGTSCTAVYLRNVFLEETLPEWWGSFSANK